MKKIILKSLISLLGLGILSTIIPSIAKASLVPTIESEGVVYPDWDRISFASLPGISQGGSFSVPQKVANELGYDPSRTWVAGQTPDQYLMLGDFQSSFQLQKLDLDTLAYVFALDISNLSLDSFGIVKHQTIKSLVEAIPKLSKLRVKQVKPIRDLLKQEKGYGYDNWLIGNVAKQSQLNSLGFETIALSKYDLDSIPGLTKTEFNDFLNWQGVYLDEIPLLSSLPFSQFPEPPMLTGAGIGIVDIAFGSAEYYTSRAISGSDREGFKVNCTGGCAHAELAGIPTVAGGQWVSGIDQEVEGGYGFLEALNGGKEPTGRHPFGQAFKLVLWDINESQGQIDSSLFFRVCLKTLFVDSCSPYFIGRAIRSVET